MLKLLWVIPGVVGAYILLLCVSSLFVDKTREYERDSAFYRFLLNSATACAIVICRLKVRVTGAEKLPEVRFLFVCNHRSKFDPIISWYIFRKNHLAFISKPENFNVPVFGRFIRKCCFMTIDRSDARSSLGTFTKAAELMKNDVVSVGVYPEGTRNRDGSLLPFHDGVFIIARKADVPIVVATIDGTEKITHNYPWKRTHIRLDIVGVIDRDFVNTHRTAAVGVAVREMMENNLKGTE